MAESKSSLLAKSVQKHAGRAKEKVSLSSYILPQHPEKYTNKVLISSFRSIAFGLRLVQNMIPSEAHHQVFFSCSRSSLV